ncbi:hypothetical protein Scep_024634 [Stephania cephalantha]|uniref:Uncharacterized protein n=1 Tax=Stephania cephalantha TaxID=152367 RepID=A0AAP0HYQ2_9MAGN
MTQRERDIEREGETRRSSSHGQGSRATRGIELPVQRRARKEAGARGEVADGGVLGDGGGRPSKPASDASRSCGRRGEGGGILAARRRERVEREANGGSCGIDESARLRLRGAQLPPTQRGERRGATARWRVAGPIDPRQDNNGGQGVVTSTKLDDAIGCSRMGREA